MPDSLEDKNKTVDAEIASLEVEADKLRMFQSQAFLMQQPFPVDKQLELEELHRRIAELQQKQMSNLLASIHESSIRLEGATRNLQQTSESQVKVAESQVKVSESQAQVMRDLLRSSHRLEQFALFLLVLTALSIFIVEQSIAPTDPTLKTIWLVLGIVSIVALMVLAYRWPLVRKDKSKLD